MKKTGHKSIQENTAETEQMSTKCVASVELNAMYLLAGTHTTAAAWRKGVIACRAYFGLSKNVQTHVAHTIHILH